MAKKITNDLLGRYSKFNPTAKINFDTPWHGNQSITCKSRSEGGKLIFECERD